MNEFKLTVEATLKIYLECLKLSVSWLGKNFLVLIATVCLIVGLLTLAPFAGGLGIAGGFVLSIMCSLITAQYYHWLRNTIQKEKIRPADIWEFDSSMFFSVIGVCFILYVADYLLAPLKANPDSRPIVMLIYFAIVFAFNALPEVVYIQRQDSFQAFSESLYFVKENWLEWYLPYILFTLPVYFISGDPLGVLLGFALMSPLYPGILILVTWADLFSSAYLGILLGFLISHLYMIFRGFLFKELYGGTRRRRVYLAKQK